MGLLRRKDDVNAESQAEAQQWAAAANSAREGQQLAAPEFTFVRSDTHSNEVLRLPDEGRGADENRPQSRDDQFLHVDDGSGSASRTRHSLDVFRSRSRSTSAGSGHSSSHRRLSQRLHLSRAPLTSSNVPDNLPEIIVPPAPLATSSDGASGAPTGAGSGSGSTAVDSGVESQWEKRATMLALVNEKQRSRPATPESRHSPEAPEESQAQLAPRHGRSRSTSVVSTKEVDADIQEAIRLHEEGELAESTRLFGILADPHGTNNPLSQVLYGLALRHGWGCEPNTEAAVRYLTAAASNAATVETLALQAGLQRGGAAKGELVLAIFELANCFRHGWGIEKDPVAAKQYYETAANLGDTDAMNEVAWCYLEGFGCKKDKYTAAKYYRLAEKNGNKTLGNTWIWKDKYDPDKQKKK